MLVMNTVSLILQLSGTVLITLAWSQNGQEHVYENTWFGSNSQYKCHCNNTRCNADGMCGDGICERGWFGPGCQYVDLIVHNASNPSWLYDGNNRTCNNNQTLQRLTVNLLSVFPFKWLRLQVAETSLLREFQVQALNISSERSVECKNMRAATVDERTLDIHCDLDVTVQKIILTGEGVKSLCSLYVSGGRNVALHQNTSQSSTYFEDKTIKPFAEKAVDGNSNSNWAHNTCSCTNTGDTNPTWNVTFSQEQRIDRYVLYNRENNQQRLKGFSLRSFTTNQETAFNYIDETTSPSSTYTIISPQSTSPITLVQIQAHSKETSDLFLTLCEVELYGDSVCPPSKYGRECQYTCNCAVKNEACFVSTGGCPSGCSAGFQGENCNKPCDFGKYGTHCNNNCSLFCITSNNSESPCDRTDGTCLHGCQNDYQLPKCDHNVNDENYFPITVAVPLIVLILVIAVLIGVVYWIRNFIRNKTLSNLVNNNEEVNSFHSEHNRFRESISENRSEHLPDPRVKLTSESKQTTKNLLYHSAWNNDGYSNSNSRASSTSVAVSNLSNFMTSHDKTFLQQQFDAIPTNTTATTTTSMREENRYKNRYKNICAYDHSRVLLKINKEKNQGDYINASYVEGYRGLHKFIASQGPTRAMLEDFVRMLSEQGVEVVVMLTNVTEDGKIKCERYWPEDGEMRTGEIRVKLTTTQVFADYTIRRLQLLQGSESVQTVTQFHFTSWPDKDVPTTAWSLVDFEQRIASLSTDKPIVVHCSAGVGRTGTFIALHNVLREAIDTGHMDFFTAVQKLRQDRAYMVQTLDQYVFLHRAAQVAIACMKTTITASNITTRIKSLLNKSHPGQTKLKLEFKAICSLCDETTDHREETTSEQISSSYENSQTVTNKVKNRFQNILAKEEYRVILAGGEGLGDYINAVFLPSFKRKNQQILTQLPLPTTVTDFWRMVLQYKVTLVVAFQVDLMHTDSSIGVYLPLRANEELPLSHFKIKSQQSSSGVSWEKQKLVIAMDSSKTTTTPFSDFQGKEHHLTHLTCRCSPNDQKPTDWLTLMAVLRSCSPAGDGRTVYMCRNGAEYGGLACVLSLLLDRLDHDHRLTVPLVVGAIKAVRPQVITTVHQYKMLYQVLELYNDSNNVYSNFRD